MKVIYPKEIDGEVSHKEAELIASMAASRSRLPGDALEIGTFRGSTTNNIAANMPNATVWTVDLPPGHLPVNKVSDADAKYLNAQKEFLPEYGSRIRQIFSDSATLNFVNPLAFAFIDGAHTFGYVLNDFALIKPNCLPGATVLFHDYNSPHWPEVTRAINHLVNTFPILIWGHYIGTTLAFCKIPKFHV